VCRWFKKALDSFLSSGGRFKKFNLRRRFDRSCSSRTVDINAMMGGDDDDTAAAGVAALAAARAAASACHRRGSRSGLSSMLLCLRAVDWNETIDMRIGD
jgi:hypothetical protein